MQLENILTRMYMGFWYSPETASCVNLIQWLVRIAVFHTVEMTRLLFSYARPIGIYYECVVERLTPF